MRRRMVAVAGVVLVFLALSGVAWAQVSPHYDLRWHTLAAGGREGMSAGSYQVHGTLGQLAIGPAQGSAHSLGAGYWYGIGRGVAEFFERYLPVLFKISLP